MMQNLQSRVKIRLDLVVLSFLADRHTPVLFNYSRRVVTDRCGYVMKFPSLSSDHGETVQCSVECMFELI